MKKIDRIGCGMAKLSKERMWKAMNEGLQWQPTDHVKDDWCAHKGMMFTDGVEMFVVTEVFEDGYFYKKP